MVIGDRNLSLSPHTLKPGDKNREPQPLSQTIPIPPCAERELRLGRGGKGTPAELAAGVAEPRDHSGLSENPAGCAGFRFIHLLKAGLGPGLRLSQRGRGDRAEKTAAEHGLVSASFLVSLFHSRVPLPKLLQRKRLIGISTTDSRPGSH